LVCKKTPSIPNQLQFRQILGFTLIELVVSMAVAAILVTVAIPNMRTFIQNGRLNTQLNDLVGDLSLARSEAIKRRKNVGICKSTNGTTCAGGGFWRDGRAVFVDEDNSGTWNGGDQILRFREPLASATDSLYTNAVLGDPIFFTPSGASSSVAVGGPVGTFNFCDDRGASKGKQLSLNHMTESRNTNPRDMVIVCNTENNMNSCA
jgi:type IV fimbrial biogenesis protein FimT